MLMSTFCKIRVDKILIEIILISLLSFFTVKLSCRGLNADKLSMVQIYVKAETFERRDQ